MSSGFMTTLNSHGIKEGSKADRPDEAKVKAEEKERKRQGRKKILQIKERERPRKRKKKRPLSNGE